MFIFQLYSEACSFIFIFENDQPKEMCVFCLFLTCSGGGAMTGWNGSNFLFLVGGRRTCGQAQNVAKGPASWAQRSRAVGKENCLTGVHPLTLG